MGRAFRFRAVFGVAVGVSAIGPGAALAGTWQGSTDPSVNPRNQSSNFHIRTAHNFPSVGNLAITLEDGTRSLASGTLIDAGDDAGSDWVLTAAHVLTDAVDVNFEVGGRLGIADTASTFFPEEEGGSQYSASEWFVPGSGTPTGAWTGNLFPGNDIALVKLSNDVEAPNAEPRPIHRPGTGVRDDLKKDIDIVGFGGGGDGGSGEVAGGLFELSAGIKRAGENRTDLTFSEFPPSELTEAADQGPFDLENPPTGRLLMSQFDMSPRAFGGQNPPPFWDEFNFEDDFPLEREYLGASGDSGGPAFMKSPRDGVGEVVAGVTSFRIGLFQATDDNTFRNGLPDSSFTDWMGSTRVKRWASWIDEVINTIEDGNDPEDLVIEGGPGSPIMLGGGGTTATEAYKRLLKDNLESLPPGLFDALTGGPRDGTDADMGGFMSRPTEDDFPEFVSGDLTGDGEVNNLDINLFIKALTEDREAFMEEAIFPPELLADMNGDGVVNNLDINAFVERLTANNAPGVVPEPSSVTLLALGGAALGLAGRSRRTRRS